MKINSRKQQKGGLLLALMLVLVVSASYVLVSKLNAASRQYTRQGASISVLNEAKAALLGYAINYPEFHTGVGPGRLPCPDTTNNGSAAGNCTGATTGRFPFKTTGLETEDFRDQHGERLWYRVANNYRSYTVSAPEVNSDLAGDFTVDSTSDIVAVIFAPGEPVGSQDRTSDPLDVTNYLEDDNADTDDTFVTRASGDFNDTLVFITRQELMSAVEKRVSGEVAQTLADYQANYGAFPWLSPFDIDPPSSDFRGEVATKTGHLPFHWTGDTSPTAGRNPFTTDIVFSWAISNANVSDPGTTKYGTISGYDLYNGSMVTPDQDCIESNVCVDGNYSGLSLNDAITFPDASCTWSNKEVFECTGTYVNTVVNTYPEVNTISDWAYGFNVGDDEIILRWDDANWVPDGAVLGRVNATGWKQNKQVQYAYTETVTRTYTINITFTDDTSDGADIVSPTSSKTRTRDLKLENYDAVPALGEGTALYNTGSNSVSITIDETRTIEVTGSPTSPSPTISVSSTRTLVNDSDTKGTLTATGIQYDIDIDEGEIPGWFVKDGWHELTFIAYASGETLPGDTTDTAPADGKADNSCKTLATTCISVSGANATGDVRAVAVIAGKDLTANRPSANASDYFESDNSTTADDAFEKSKTTLSYNDQTRVVSVAQ